ncbi:hypothetical protein KIN20_026127 [Parelaphostrongylus tenuis]|uniref:Thioredoxin domain-containing protein n=1 Tax=Parelaphostrongylus tenuis TaxID=148309 RepID=A0AAD5QXH0_PARTN|nr:hypothetical protein KIN20_026127 [Parelaphostrongylus tenuis]
MVIRSVLGLATAVQLIVGDVVQLDTSNFDAITKSNDIVFVNFYADWCRFSQMLKPIFAEASEKFQNLPQGKVVWGAVDADRQAELASRFQVNKYPTLKLFRNGEVVRKEYRSQRSVEALSEFVQKQLDSGINEVQSQEDLNNKLNKEKRNVIAYFSQLQGQEYESLKKVASVLREECSFYVGSGPAFSAFISNGPKLSFMGANGQEALTFTGDLKDYDFLKQWLTDKCIPLEGIPFLILFRHPDDKQSEKIFTDAVVRDLHDQKAAINCLILSDICTFSQVLVILAFLENYGSLFWIYTAAKLHREFHNGPDPVVQVSSQLDLLRNGLYANDLHPEALVFIRGEHTTASALCKLLVRSEAV